jgi:hypothetical protein
MANAVRPRKKSQAARADRHVYYERAVQGVDLDCDFIDVTFKKMRGRRPTVFREDFCGTAAISQHWVSRGPRHQAIGIDLDPEVLAWAREHRLPRMSKARLARLELIEGNVLTARSRAVDVVGAFNFSYWVFKDRALLRRYFRRVRSSLVKDGLFFLDAYGGYEAYKEMLERTKLRGFTYVWDQASYNPINGDIVCHINFNFPDGSRMAKAFTYEWRLWSLPELQEILGEAGFKNVTVYWEGTAKNGKGGNGIFTPQTKGDADAGWVVYLVAEP